MRLGTIQLLHAAMGSPAPTVLRALAPYVSTLPAMGQASHPVRDGDGGPPASIGKYLVVVAALAMFAFVMMNVDSDKQVSLTPEAGGRDLLWALVIGSIYWANSLLTRTAVIHPAEPVTRNFGYNSKEVTILAFAVLTGGLVVVVRQNMGLGPSGWTVMGPLLFFRFLYDLWASLQALRPSSPQALKGEPSMRASRSQGPS
jgi:hypothetical protein